MTEKTYVKPADLDIAALIAEINTAMTANVAMIHDEGANIRIVMDADFTAEEATLDSTVSAHPLLDNYKAKHATNMSESVQTFIYSKYDAETQSSLEALYARAVNGGNMPNRAAHIAAAIDWMDDVLTDFYADKTTIMNAIDKAAVDAVTWDWETEYGATGTLTADPAVTIESALAITT